MTGALVWNPGEAVVIQPATIPDEANLPLAILRLMSPGVDQRSAQAVLRKLADKGTDLRLVYSLLFQASALRIMTAVAPSNQSRATRRGVAIERLDKAVREARAALQPGISSERPLCETLDTLRAQIKSYTRAHPPVKSRASHRPSLASREIQASLCRLGVARDDARALLSYLR